MILSTNNWYTDWKIIVGICAIATLLILAIIIPIIIVSKKRNKIKNEESNKKQNATFLDIFGGEDNIISCEAKGSRLVLVLNDYSKLDEERLKDNGVTSLIKATNKVTLIIGEKSKDLENFINENKRP